MHLLERARSEVCLHSAYNAKPVVTCSSPTADLFRQTRSRGLCADILAIRSGKKAWRCLAGYHLRSSLLVSMH